MRGLVYPIIAVVVALFLYFLADPATPPAEQPVTRGQAGATSLSPKQPRVPIIGNNFVIDISVHTLDELRDVLEHAEKLANQPKPAGERANIALMLHGPEVDFFRIDKYEENRAIVDLAARLDAYNAVEIKMCETMMRQRGIERNNVPGFIELVPNGEREIERLEGRGYEVL